MDALRKAGDSIGAKVDIMATKVPVGLGNPLFEKLDAEIAAAMMGINAVKGVEIGDGFASVAQKVPSMAMKSRLMVSRPIMRAVFWVEFPPVRISVCPSAHKPDAFHSSPRQSIDGQG